MPEPDNPFEQLPGLNPSMAQSLEFVRLIFGRAGIRLSRFVLAVEIDGHDREGKPLRTAASWPMDEMDKGADLAKEATTILRMSHAAKHTRGQG